jgi:hypothetical protein
MLTYSGTDPTNPDNWSLVGLYSIAAPVGGAETSGSAIYPNRAYLRYGGDIYITTSSDHTKLSQLIIALKMGQMPPRSRVSQAVQDAVANGGSLPGWQAVFWGYRRRILVNIPRADGTYQQHVYNPALDAWCRYLNLPAVCWVVFQDRLFFGSPTGQVIEHGVGNSDILSPTTNNPITSYGWQAWNLFGSPLTKRVAAIRAIVQSVGEQTVTLGLGYDYLDPSVSLTFSDAGAVSSAWDTSPWGSPWSTENTVDPLWQIAGGEGTAISLALTTAGSNQKIWVRTDFRLEPGRAL